MIITRKTGLKLIRAKKAQHVCLVTCGTSTGDRLYVCITRSDLQRTDHFPAIYKDQRESALSRRRRDADALAAHEFACGC